VIYFVATERFCSTVLYFLKSHRKQLRGILRSLTYEELFFERAGPIGHYIFTDFDRLSRYELEGAAAFAMSLRSSVPEAQILNNPLRALERYPLLVALHKHRINDFTAIRIDCGDRPTRYPVFIRAEDGYGGPETDLITDDAEFDAAVEALVRRGLPLRGRIAVGFMNRRSRDGYFRKYGAFNVGGRIVPHDVMYSPTWIIKIRQRDEAYGASEPGVREELGYISENPHESTLRRAFEIAGIDYGRADYGVVDGRVQIYEINTNPHLPYEHSVPSRMERQTTVRRSLLEAFKALDTPLAATGRISFKLSRPRAHDLHFPRRRLPISLMRRAIDLVAGRHKRESD
jgi:hypothetical protein